jgi:photosystem II stability/assembly factor-like uncharacterized protein
MIHRPLLLRSSPSGENSNRWVQSGPTVIPKGGTYSRREPTTRVDTTGRITAIAPDPKDGKTIFVGAAQGGVWKTNDSGRTWMPTTDNAISLAIGALVIDPNNSNVIYAGTGE